jgi:hypothetical protein
VGRLSPCPKGHFAPELEGILMTTVRIFNVLSLQIFAKPAISPGATFPAPPIFSEPGVCFSTFSLVFSSNFLFEGEFPVKLLLGEQAVKTSEVKIIPENAGRK